MRRRDFLAAGAASALGLAAIAPKRSPASDFGRKKTELDCHSRSFARTLPLTIDIVRGIFTDEGFGLNIAELTTSSHSLMNLATEPTAVVTGAYECSFDIWKEPSDNAPGRPDCRATVFAVPKERAASIKSIVDLRDPGICGNSYHPSSYFLSIHLSTNSDDKSMPAPGNIDSGTAIAGILTGNIDAITSLIAHLSTRDAGGSMTILATSRTTEETWAISDSTAGMSVLYAPTRFANARPETTTRIVSAFTRTMKRIASHTPPDHVANSAWSLVWRGDKDIYARAAPSFYPTFSRTGLISGSEMKTLLQLMKFNDLIGNKNIDIVPIALTFDRRWLTAQVNEHAA